MKCLRFSLAFFIGLVFTPSLPAQTKPAATPPVASAKHSLWRVEGKTNAVYFFGSIHFLKQEFYPLDAPIEDAFKKCAAVDRKSTRLNSSHVSESRMPSS